MANLARHPSLQSAVCSSTIGSCTVIDMQNAAGGIFLLDSTCTNQTSVTFWVCDTATGTYVQLADSAAADPNPTVAASHAYAIPDCAFASSFLKIKGNSGTANTFKILLKS